MNILEKLSASFRFLGLSNTLLSILSTLQRDLVEWRYKSSSSSGKPIQPGPLRSASQTPQGGKFEFTNARLEINFLKSDLIRLSWGPGKESPSYAVIKDDWDPVGVSYQQTPQGGYDISSSHLGIEISTYGALTYTDPEGQILRVEQPPTRQGPAWNHTANLADEEKIHGLGEKAAPLNLRAADPGGGSVTYEIRNQDIGGFYSTGDDPLYFGIPLYLSRKPSGGYLIFYDNPFRGAFTFDHPGSKDPSQVKASFQGGRLRYYFTPGPPAKSLRTYSELTGRPPLPPKWSLGYHQCRWGYKNADQVRDVVQGFKERDLPLSAVHLDIDYMDGYRIFTVDEGRFPDLGRLSDELSQDGIHLVAILDPCIKQDKDYELFQEGQQAGHFCKLPNGKTMIATVWPGRSAFPDFSHPDSRTWWGEQYGSLLEQGVDGFWHDMNEPSAFTAWGEPGFPTPTRYHLEGLGGDHIQANNLYGLLMNRAGYEALRDQQPQRRPWLLSRSGWAGNQRYAWNWTGDVSTSWGALRQTLTTMLNLGLSGIPYTGSDIGGFGGHPSPDLFTRWFQMAAFTPFFRGHSATGTPRREPWVYGEPYTAVIQEFLLLRYKLIPYLYTQSWKSHRSGHPIMRPLFWADGNDELMDGAGGAFLLGDNLLVAPVLEEKQRTKQVIFPPGEWVSFWDEKVVQGPEVLNFETSIERIPLFVRGGSLLPLDEGGELHFHLYPPSGKSSPKRESALYQDEGDGYGPHRVDRFSMRKSRGQLRLTWKSEGDYPTPGDEVTLIIHGDDQASGVEIDGEEGEIEGNKLLTPPFQKAIFSFEEDPD